MLLWISEGNTIYVYVAASENETSSRYSTSGFAFQEYSRGRVDYKGLVWNIYRDLFQPEMNYKKH